VVAGGQRGHQPGEHPLRLHVRRLSGTQLARAPIAQSNLSRQNGMPT
jgi:hypothetical protein